MERSPEVREKVYSVSEVVQTAREVLEGHFGIVVVEGEISNFKPHSSGHFYLTLKDERSQLKSAMFRASSRGMGFELADGMKVLATGRLSIYTARGDFQLVVDRLEPAGLGALQLAFEQLKKKLAAEGLFDASRKRALPRFPRRIGVITSPTGAVWQDILNTTARRAPWIDLVIYPVRVQGEGAAEEIAHALERMNELGNVDVIICGRGGGSLEDLWAFNEERVARALAASRIPVISAVGHEVDFTIADFTADARAATPTAAAEMATPELGEILERLAALRRLLGSAMRSHITRIKSRLDRLAQSPVLQNPRRVLEPLWQRLDEAWVSITGRVTRHVTWKNEQLKLRVGHLEALSPLRIMERGYSLVRHDSNGQLARRSSELTPGEALRIQFWEGQATAKVLAIQNKGSQE
jgi:exodeoxyribonuclease VII large subunit